MLEVFFGLYVLGMVIYFIYRVWLIKHIVYSVVSNRALMISFVKIIRDEEKENPFYTYFRTNAISDSDIHRAINNSEKKFIGSDWRQIEHSFGIVIPEEPNKEYWHTTVQGWNKTTYFKHILGLALIASFVWPIVFLVSDIHKAKYFRFYNTIRQYIQGNISLEQVFFRHIHPEINSKRILEQKGVNEFKLIDDFKNARFIARERASIISKQ